MIRVRKPAAPAVLRKNGWAATRRLCERFEAGETQFDFDRSIYAHATVKAALRKAQHDKCCFCESKVTHVAHGDVEHFRPKAGSCQEVGDALRTPGYYWLAYDWDNLLFCCQLCNQRHKRNLFPLANPARRATSHRHSITSEAPLFVHPALDDPSRYITFHDEYAVAVDGNDRGTKTIVALELNRPDLREVRGESLASLVLLRHCSKSIDDDIVMAERHGRKAPAAKRRLQKRLAKRLHELTLDSSQFTAMARAALV